MCILPELRGIARETVCRGLEGDSLGSRSNICDLRRGGKELLSLFQAYAPLYIYVATF